MKKHFISKKKKPARKQVSKPSISKPAAPVNSMALVTVPISEITKPETYKGKLSIIPTPFTERQIMQLISPTPKDVIMKRPGKGGKDFDYIPGWWFRKKLNFTFGWMHDFEILGERIDGKFVTVKGKLTIKDTKGNILVTKTDFGGHPIQFLKGTNDFVDISNDFKAAATDCMKRCAVQLGIGLDVYSAGDYQQGDRPIAMQQPTQPAKPVEAQVMQVDYVAKLNKYLDEHPRGPFTVAEKIRFVFKQTGIQADWIKLTQQQAQVIYATLIRNK